MLTLLILAPILATLTIPLARSAASLRSFATAWSTGIGLLALATTYPILRDITTIPGNGFWQVTPFAALLILLIGFIQWTATLVSGPYIDEELHEKIITLSQARIYYALLQVFVLSMILTLAAQNIGIMWIALEGTTLATTLLVAFYGRDGSLEAAWKYILLCSVGISLGLLGIFLLYFATTTAAPIASDLNILNWTQLHAIASTLPPQIVRWAFIFIFIGYGTKVGLVPLHTWLPDAHGRTPSPISAMLSGLLLNVALFAILKYKGVVDLTLGETWWTNRLFLIFGTLSILLPTAFILVQRNYKRLLAYSSIEHMGFMVFCVGLGAPGLLIMTIHMIGHALAKSLAFFGSGNIILRWKSTKIENIGPVLTSLPYTGILFLIALLALIGTPPSPLFLSEYLALTIAIVSHPFLAILVLAAGVILLAGILCNLIPMLFQKKTDPVTSPIESWNISHTAMALHVAALAVIGILVMTPATQTYLKALAESIL